MPTPRWVWAVGAVLTAAHGLTSRADFLPPPGVMLGELLALAWGLTTAWLAWSAFGPRVVLRDDGDQPRLGDEPLDRESHRYSRHLAVLQSSADAAVQRRRGAAWQEDAMDRVATRVTHLRERASTRPWLKLTSVLALLSGGVPVLGGPLFAFFLVVALTATVGMVVNAIRDMDGFREEEREVSVRGGMVLVSGEPVAPVGHCRVVYEHGEEVLVAERRGAADLVVVRGPQAFGVFRGLRQRAADVSGGVPAGLNTLLGRGATADGA